jgi:UDP-glucose 4-epimerase
MILVTGGAGYIGSHAIIALIEKGFDVVIFDSLENGHIETIDALKNIEAKGKIVDFIRGDLKNPNDIRSVFKNHKIELVMHFAAYISVEESVKNPLKYYNNNLVGSLNLINAMVENKVDKIVYSSTAAIYGDPDYVPIDEEHGAHPINPYGHSKIMVEKILDDCDVSNGLKSVRLRYFNVAGADELSRVGEWHEPESHLIPNLIKSVHDSEKVFRLYGDSYDTKDGTCVRDYVNVEDLADAHVMALRYLMDGGSTNWFNLGTAEGNTIREVLNVCERITRRNIKIEICDPRVGDSKSLVANNKKAIEILGWKPKRTLENSMETAYKWHKKKR